MSRQLPGLPLLYGSGQDPTSAVGKKRPPRVKKPKTRFKPTTSANQQTGEVTQGFELHNVGGSSKRSDFLRDVLTQMYSGVETPTLNLGKGRR